jgi:hypothetical protein
MALLIPLAFLAVGACLIGYSAWRDPEAKGAGFALFLYFVLFGGTLGCVGIGAWGYARTGQWDSITLAGLLASLEKAGVNLGWLRAPAPWSALQDLNRWYLELNLAWTLLVVPAVLIGFWMLLPRAAPAGK